jgi:hypothetical protein
MEGNRSSTTLEFEFVLHFQLIYDLLRFLTNTGEIIDVDTDVFVHVTIASHPYVQFRLGRREAHISEAISEAFTPVSA